jgi:hypothetical protein
VQDGNTLYSFHSCLQAVADLTWKCNTKPLSALHVMPILAKLNFVEPHAKGMTQLYPLLHSERVLHPCTAHVKLPCSFPISDVG